MFRWAGCKLIPLLVCVCACGELAAQAPEFMALAAARPVLRAMHDTLPPELRAEPLTAEQWDQWVRSRDREIRRRVAQGEELTLANLLRLGMAYTSEPRITYDLLARDGHDAQVDATVRRRARDLTRALTAPRDNEGLLQMRSSLHQRGFSLDTPEARDKVQTYLLAVLARQRDEVSREQARARLAHANLFEQRGLSTDSDLYTGYTLEIVLEDLARRGVLKRGSVRQVAIVGPGLDYANKKSGYDFYPPQTLQPFAVVDTLLRLGLADRTHLHVQTFDISPRVNEHIERARSRAAAGLPYTLQLPLDRALSVSEAVMWQLGAYWQRLGDRIATPAAAAAVPAAVAPDVSLRAVNIPPDVVAMISPRDLNIVLQDERLAPEQRFDLAIGTNIFLYYDPLEQSLAKANLAAMLKAGGLLISNTALPVAVPSALADPVRMAIPLGRGVTDEMFTYARRQ